MTNITRIDSNERLSKVVILDVLLRHSLRFAAQLHAVQLRQHAGEGHPLLDDCILWRCGETEA